MWTLCINRPGYLPDGIEPVSFDTWADARKAWSEAIASAITELCECEEWTIDRADREFDTLRDALDLAENMSPREQRMGALYMLNGLAYDLQWSAGHE